MKDTRGVNHLEINCASADGRPDITYYVADDTSGELFFLTLLGWALHHSTWVIWKKSPLSWSRRQICRSQWKTNITHVCKDNCYQISTVQYYSCVLVKQSVGLRHWHQAINNALYPMTGPAMTAADTAKVTRQVSRFQSLDPEERNATDVEQIYQVKLISPNQKAKTFYLRFSVRMSSDQDNLALSMAPDIEPSNEKWRSKLLTKLASPTKNQTS